MRQVPVTGRDLALSHQTVRIINQNLLWGMAFIAVFVLGASIGVINPIVGALLHEFSAFGVIFNSAWLLRFDAEHGGLVKKTGNQHSHVPEEMSDLICFENVTLGYRQRVVLRDLRFTIRAGEFFGIVGANGSGKTTILRALLGILRPLHGQVLARIEPGQVDGLPEGGWCDLSATPGAVRFGYVPQRGFLDEMYPLTARDIVLMGRYGALGLLTRPGQRDRQLVEQALAHVGLAELAGQRYADLSGGQKQRVLIARALASEARVLVLDEPTDGMDLEGQRGIMDLIARLPAERGVTVVYVTHRLNELGNVAQRLMLLHEGAVRIGPVAEILTPAVLESVYGVPVRVEQFDGKRVVLT